MEEWRPVPGYDYEVSDLGRVRRTTAAMGTWPGKILKTYIHKNCRYVYVYFQPGHKSRLVHSLVAEAFIGPKPPGKETNHKDFDRQNNALSNLEYLTPAENYRHSDRHGRMFHPKGEKHGMAVLTEEQVQAIRREYVPRKVPYRVLAERYGVTLTAVQMAAQGSTWKHIPTTALSERYTKETRHG